VSHTNKSLLARTVRGLEWVAAEEIARVCSATDIRLRERGVLFELPSGDLSSALKLRTVDDVFLRIAELPGVGRGKKDVSVLASGVLGADLPEAVTILGSLREISRRPTFDVVTSMDGNRRYNRFDVEEAVGRRVAARYGWRFVSHEIPEAATTPSMTLRLLLEGDRGLVTVRTAAQPMHRRPYKVQTGRGTLHPPLAHMLAVLADPGPAARLGDPFCGDGTILIESGHLGVRAFGSDLDFERVCNSVENARRARCHVSYVVADACALPYHGGSWDRVVTNPPWDVAVEAAGRLRQESGRAWRELSRVLRADGLGVTLVAADSGTERQLQAAGLPVVFRQDIRISGRIGRVLMFGETARLSKRLDAWRRTCLAAGVIDDEGF